MATRLDELMGNSLTSVIDPVATSAPASTSAPTNPWTGQLYSGGNWSNQTVDLSKGYVTPWQQYVPGTDLGNGTYWFANPTGSQIGTADTYYRFADAAGLPFAGVTSGAGDPNKTTQATLDWINQYVKQGVDYNGQQGFTVAADQLPNLSFTGALIQDRRDNEKYAAKDGWNIMDTLALLGAGFGGYELLSGLGGVGAGAAAAAETGLGTGLVDLSPEIAGWTAGLGDIAAGMDLGAGALGTGALAAAEAAGGAASPIEEVLVTAPKIAAETGLGDAALGASVAATANGLSADTIDQALAQLPGADQLALPDLGNDFVSVPDLNASNLQLPTDFPTGQDLSLPNISMSPSLPLGTPPTGSEGGSPGGSGGTPSENSWWDKITKWAGKGSNAIGVAGLVANLLAANKAKNAGKDLASTLKGIAGNTSGISQDLLNQYKSGQINSGTEGDIQRWQRAQIARAKQFGASSGTADSTSTNQRIADIEKQANDMRDLARQGLLQSGLSAAGVTNPILIQAAQAQAQQDAQFAQAQSGALSSLFKLLASTQETKPATTGSA